MKFLKTGIHVFGLTTVPIEIIDAQPQLPVFRSCPQPCCMEGPSMSKM